MSNPWEDFAPVQQASASPWEDFQPEEQQKLKSTTKSIGDMALGGLEAAGSLLSSGVAMPLGFAAAVMQKANNPSGVDFEQQVGANMDKYTYEPKTQLGQEYAGKVGQVFNDVGIPAIAHLGGTKLPGLMDGGVPKAFGRDVPVPEAFGRDVPVPEVGKATSKADALLKAREGVKTAPWEDFAAPEGGAGAFDRIQSDLGFKEGETSPVRQPEGQTPMTSMADTLTQVGDTARATDAQTAIDLRQKAMEDSITKQTSLEQNAAERARQEQAPVYSDEHLGLIEQQKAQEAARVAEEQKQADIVSRRNDNEQMIQQGRDSLVKAEEAQKQIDLRNEQTRLDIQRQSNLDFNAAERARQEVAPTTIPTALNRPSMQGQRGAINVRAISEEISKGLSKFNDGFKAITNIGFDTQKQTHEYLSTNIPGAKEALQGRLAVPDAPTKVLQDAMNPAVKDIPEFGSIRNAVQSGPGLTAAKFRAEGQDHPLLLSVGRNLDYALKKGDFQVRELVHPLERMFSKLSSKDVAEVHDVLKTEMFNRARFTDAELSANYTPKQIQVYKAMRAALDTALEIQNKSREILGKKPISEGDAYLASTWHGDWHTPVLDKNGNLAWYIRTTTAKEGARALDYLRKTMGDTLAIPDKLKPEFRDTGRNPNTPNDVMGAYKDMQDFFKDSPEISAQIKEALSSFMESKGYSAGGQSKHFLKKGNIRGFEGDTPWKSPEENAYGGIKAQMDYIRGATKWSHLQEAIANTKQVLSDPQIVEKMPNAVAYAKSVMAKELGIDSNVTGGIEKSLAKMMGVSKSSLYRGTADLKTMTYLQTLGLSPAYMLATPLQAIMTTPSWHRMLTAEGFKHNIAKTTMLATADTMSGIANHISHELGFGSDKVPMTTFGKQALQYAEDAGIVSKNLFDESQGLGQHAPLAKVQSSLGWTIGFPEKVARLSAFMSFAHHLEASGKFADKMEMFRKADELTDRSMTSFKPHDRPQVVANLGAAGQLGYTFKSFLFNGFNQLSVFSREAHDYMSTKGKSGSVTPLLSSVGMYALMGGLASMPLVEEMNMLWNTTKDMVAEYMPQHYSDVQGVGLKGSLISLLPQTSGFRDIVGYGIPSATLDLQLASRMNLGSGFDVEKPFQGIAPVAQEMKEWGSLGGAAVHMNKDAVLSGIYQSMPPLIKGQMESQMSAFRQGENPGNQGIYKPTDLTNPTLASHRRTVTDEDARKLGTFSLNEARDKETQFINSEETQRIKTAQGKLMERVLNGVKNKDQEAVGRNALAYFKLNPDSQAFDSALTNGLMKMNLTPQEMALTKMRSIAQINTYRRYQGMNK